MLVEMSLGQPGSRENIVFHRNSAQTCLHSQCRPPKRTSRNLTTENVLTVFGKKLARSPHQNCTARADNGRPRRKLSLFAFMSLRIMDKSSRIPRDFPDMLPDIPEFPEFSGTSWRVREGLPGVMLAPRPSRVRCFICIPCAPFLRARNYIPSARSASKHTQNAPPSHLDSIWVVWKILLFSRFSAPRSASQLPKPCRSPGASGHSPPIQL